MAAKVARQVFKLYSVRLRIKPLALTLIRYQLNPSIKNLHQAMTVKESFTETDERPGAGSFPQICISSDYSRLTKFAWASRGLVLAILISALFAGLISVWFSFDHRLPAHDESGHILNSYRYSELLAHPRVWKLDWWHECLTVNRFYPPFVYMLTGALRLVSGSGRQADIISVGLFDVMLTLSVYGITKLLTGARRPAVIAALLINLYPSTFVLSHTYMLDFPLVAMVGMGLFSLVWWGERPSWKRAFASGVVVGCACMTKQIAAAYLMLPGIYFLIRSLYASGREMRLKILAQALLIAGTTCGVVLPWLVTNHAYIRAFASEYHDSLGQSSIGSAFWAHLSSFGTRSPQLVSPLLFTMLVLSLVLAKRPVHLSLLPVSLSALGGVLFVSMLTWQTADLRYVVPALIAASVYSGCGLWLMSASRSRWYAYLPALILPLAFLQFVSFAYTPYPLSSPAFLQQLSTHMGLGVDTFSVAGESKNNPQPPSVDWGQRWALKTIDSIDHGLPVWLNILPNSFDINPHTFEFLAHDMGLKLRPASSRIFSAGGDKVSFSPESAKHFQWYVLKDGEQGHELDHESEQDYARLTSYVQNGGAFAFVAQHPLPDGSTLLLYRQK